VWLIAFENNVDTLGEIASRNSYIAIKSCTNNITPLDDSAMDTEMKGQFLDYLKEIKKCMLKLTVLLYFTVRSGAYVLQETFGVATFEGMELFHVDYKIILIIAQVLGYALLLG
jgi:hypothetical protein